MVTTITRIPHDSHYRAIFSHHWNLGFSPRLDLGYNSNSVSRVSWNFDQCLIIHFSPYGPRILPSPRLGIQVNQRLTSFLGYPFGNHFLATRVWDSLLA
ncbi:hypothetical protein E6C27_scaffold221G00490 [Cucumis melo var. makuwa]|uniref:Uncharacterized protein n=1 Tax=Cucumis melo var. makuwa TaxID=1194695 RepID=A0A5A7UPA8_CUCMM|nr:hypothetical protein E6C27_scaffold221G00490 [Cucumis melo var. makuwa]